MPDFAVPHEHLLSSAKAARGNKTPELIKTAAVESDGYLAAKSTATIPTMLCPMMIAFWILSWLQTSARSSSYCVVVPYCSDRPLVPYALRSRFIERFR